MRVLSHLNILFIRKWNNKQFPQNKGTERVCEAQSFTLCQHWLWLFGEQTDKALFFLCSIQLYHFGWQVSESQYIDRVLIGLLSDILFHKIQRTSVIMCFTVTLSRTILSKAELASIIHQQSQVPLKLDKISFSWCIIQKRHNFKLLSDTRWNQTSVDDVFNTETARIQISRMKTRWHTRRRPGIIGPGHNYTDVWLTSRIGTVAF